MIDLLRRAWDALDTFKQTYPENWHEDDQQVLDDLMKADLDLSGVKREWVGLTDEEIWKAISRIGTSDSDVNPYAKLADARAIEQALKEKNT